MRERRDRKTLVQPIYLKVRDPGEIGDEFEKKVEVVHRGRKGYLPVLKELMMTVRWEMSLPGVFILKPMRTYVFTYRMECREEDMRKAVARKILAIWFAKPGDALIQKLLKEWEGEEDEWRRIESDWKRAIVSVVLNT